jgi:hypothetical protein
MRLVSKSTQSSLLLMLVILAGVFACAQTPTPAITLEPATGWELQAHLFDSKGIALPEAPSNFRRLGEARVGELADLHSLTFRFSEAVTLTGIKSTADFRIEKGGSCEAGNTFQKDTTCTLLMRFTPQGPGNRLGRLTISTGNSATPMAFGIGGIGYSPALSFIPSVIQTVAGSYPANVGLLNSAQNLTVSGADRLYIADFGNNLIRSMDSSGTFKTVVSGYSLPQSVAVDTYGQVYFLSSLVIYQAFDYSASIRLLLGGGLVFSPWNLSMDPNNRLYFEEGTHGAAYFQALPYPSTVTPYQLYDPFAYVTTPPGAFAVDSIDNFYTSYIAGGDCQIIQQPISNLTSAYLQFNRIVGGQSCGFSGDGGPAGNAEISAVVGQIAFDIAGNMYFTDTDNQRVRRVDAVTGIIRTIAGNGVEGYTGDGGPATSAALDSPTGVAVDSQGQVYIISYAALATRGDPFQVVRKVTGQGVISFGNQVRTTPSTVHLAKVSNTGNSTMVLTILP